jgi:hypothetical protein
LNGGSDILTFRTSYPTLGRSFEALMGNDEFSKFDSLLDIIPPPEYDSLIYSYTSLQGLYPTNCLSSPWTDCVLTSNFFQFSFASRQKVGTGGLPKCKYKPVDQKVQPVPTYMPDPQAQEFKDIPPPVLTILPVHPINYRQLDFGKRVTLERLETMLKTIEKGVLMEDEINLMAFVIVKRESAFAFNYAEKGFFSQEYFPDYEIPTIEHIPWQSKPIPIPKSLYNDVIAIVRDNEVAGRFEPTTSSY